MLAARDGFVITFEVNLSHMSKNCTDSFVDFIFVSSNMVIIYGGECDNISPPNYDFVLNLSEL